MDARRGAGGHQPSDSDGVWLEAACEALATWRSESAAWHDPRLYWPRVLMACAATRPSTPMPAEGMLALSAPSSSNRPQTIDSGNAREDRTSVDDRPWVLADVKYWSRCRLVMNLGMMVTFAKLE